MQSTSEKELINEVTRQLKITATSDDASERDSKSLKREELRKQELKTTDKNPFVKKQETTSSSLNETSMDGKPNGALEQAATKGESAIKLEKVEENFGKTDKEGFIKKTDSYTSERNRFGFKVTNGKVVEKVKLEHFETGSYELKLESKTNESSDANKKIQIINVHDYVDVDPEKFWKYLESKCAQNSEDKKLDQIVHEEQDDLLEIDDEEIDDEEIDDEEMEIMIDQYEEEWLEKEREAQKKEDEKNGKNESNRSVNRLQALVQRMNTVTHTETPHSSDGNTEERPSTSSTPRTPRVQYEEQMAQVFMDANKAMKFVIDNPRQNLFVRRDGQDAEGLAFIVRAAREMAALGKKVVLKTDEDSNNAVLEELKRQEEKKPLLPGRGQIFKLSDYEEKQRRKTPEKNKRNFNKKFKYMQLIVVPWNNEKYQKYVIGLTNEGRFVPDVVCVEDLNQTTPAWMELNMSTYPKQIIGSFEEGNRGQTYGGKPTSVVTELIFGDERAPKKEFNYLRL